MFDRYFKDIPCYDDSCPAVNISNGWNATFYLIGWYWAWTGGLTNEWSFRMPSWNIHQQHQNPLSAYILSTTSAFQPKTANGKNQWKMVLNTTIDFWQWLQTDKGGIASGATNSINGEYDNPIQNGVTGFFTDGLPYLSFTDSYNEETNDRFLYQAISQERNAEYCYLSDDDKACNILNNWIQWILSLNSSILLPNNEYRVPQKIQFFGQPNNYSAQFVQNSALSVEIVSYDQEIGSASVLAHALTYYAKKTGNINAKNLARELLDRMYLYVDNLGIGINETRQDYIGDVNGKGFWEPVDVPAHCYGKYPNGDNIEQGVTFIDTRSWYRNDPSWPKVEAGKQSNVAPIFIYHRFWEQAQYAIACADYVRLFGDSN